MPLSKKCHYAIKGLFELARRQGQWPIKIREVATAQEIPARFLEVIFGQLKRAGFVDARRGVDGGYSLAKVPSAITIGDVIRYVNGPISPVAERNRPSGLPMTTSESALSFLWRDAEKALAGVYDSTTFQDLVERDQKAHSGLAPSYAI
jgi:Rrf2 family transcriptional regulator, cysteine metabolism repressor